MFLIATVTLLKRRGRITGVRKDEELDYIEKKIQGNTSEPNLSSSCVFMTVLYLNDPECLSSKSHERRQHLDRGPDIDVHYLGSGSPTLP